MRTCTLVALALNIGVLVSTLPQVAAASGDGRRPTSLIRTNGHGYLDAGLVSLFVLSQHGGFTRGYLGHGGGISLAGGYRFNRYLSLQGGVLFSANEDAWRNAYLDINVLLLGLLQLEGKIHFPLPGRRVEPYVQLGLGYAILDAQYGKACAHPEYSGCSALGSLFSSGPTFAVGGGVDLYATSWLSVGGKALFRGIAFQEQDDAERLVRDANFVTSLAIALQATVHF